MTVIKNWFTGVTQASGKTVVGTIANDTIYGGSGDDVLTGGVGSDVIYGGNGNDFIYGDGGPAQPTTNQIVVQATGDTAFGIEPIMQVRVNGVLVGTVNVPTTLADGSYPTFTFSASGSVPITSISVAFTNNTYGTQSQDRNLFLRSVTLNGVTLDPQSAVNTESKGTYDLWANGSISYDLTNHPDYSVGTHTSDDKLYGGAGDDMLVGGAGNDFIDGGAGNDTAIYMGNRADYKITQLSNGELVVQDSVANRDGTDTLTNVENLLFQDGEVKVSDLITPAVAISSQILAHDTGASTTDNITSNGSVTLTGTLTVLGVQVGVTGTSVQIFDGSKALGNATVNSDGTWSYAATLSAGTYALHAVATDSAGVSTATAAQPSILVETAAPAVAFTSEAQTTNSGVILNGTLTGAAGTTVEIYNGSTALGTATLDGRGGWTYTTSSLAAGAYSFHATATDIAGNTATSAQAFTVTAPVPTGTDTLVLNLSEDAYQGDAQFTVSVDGKQIGGVETVTALHGSGQSQDFTLTGNFGAGPHTVSVDFINDKYGGSQTKDRNLYVNSITLDDVTTTENKVQLNRPVAKVA